MLKPKSTSSVRVMRFWQIVRRRMMAVLLIAGFGSTFWQPASTQGQESVVASPVSTPVPAPIPVPAKNHLEKGPLDLNNLPSDILHCDVCRQRLGLPPLQRSNTAPATVPSNKANSQPGADLSNFAPVRILGSQGLITSGTASQMVIEGLVVEEFRPPMPEAGAINLGCVPLEVRQQFMLNLELPEGATIMPAQIASGNQKPVIESAKPSEAKEKEVVVDPLPALPTPPPPLSEKPQSRESTAAQSLGVPGLGSAPEDSNSKPSSTVESTESPASAPSKTAASKEAKSKMQTQLDSMKQAQIEREQKAEAATREMAESMAKMRAETEEQISRIEASKREIAKRLETRTKELSKLQAVLKEKERELAQAKASAKQKIPKKNQGHPKKHKSDSAKDL